MAKSSRVVVGIQSGLLFLAWALACVTLAGASDKPAVMKGSYWVKQGDDTYLNYWGSCTKSDDSSGGDAPSSGGEPSGGEPSGGDSPPAGFPSSGGDSPSSGGNRMLRLLQQGGHRRLSSWTCHSAKDVNKDQDRFRPMAGMAAMGWLFTTAYFVLTLAKLVPPLAPRLRTLDIAGLVAGGFAWMFSLACWGQGVDLYGVDNNHDAHHVLCHDRRRHVPARPRRVQPPAVRRGGRLRRRPGCQGGPRAEDVRTRLPAFYICRVFRPS